MGYLHAWWNYIKTPKGQHDLLDYIRAAIIMASVMAMLRILVDMVFGNF
ncbi:MAG TPA: hypothetical protein VGL27_16010 [Negativicutes bacterium]|jgi:hypothetical protein